jgi:hypothetical protein
MLYFDNSLGYGLHAGLPLFILNIFYRIMTYAHAIISLRQYCLNGLFVGCISPGLWFRLVDPPAFTAPYLPVAR